jgi:luciferase family oxidoreductase group 1
VAATLRLSVLDQSPIPSGSSVTRAFENSVDLARFCEALGYERYWLAEHHGTTGLAGSAPEVLIAHVAANTSAIRVGSGGVMLSHYSPLKVAEQFRVLEALHPGRIDLGIGRAPGSEQLAALALQRNREHPSSDDFIEQIAELLAWFDSSFPTEHPFSRLRATPIPDGAPELWLLSSSGYSAKVAAHFGAGLCFAHFISADGGPEAIETYRDLFRGDDEHDKPKASVAIGVICADSDEEAEHLAESGRLWRFRQRRYGERGPVPSVAEALAYSYSDIDRGLLEAGRGRAVVGGPERVRAEVEALALAYKVDEVVVVTITHDHGARRRSYELLAEMFSLTPRT